MDARSESGQPHSRRLNSKVIFVFRSLIWSFALCIILLFGLATMGNALLRNTGFVALVVFLALSLALLFLTAKAQGARTLKFFLYLTGSAGALFTLFLLLSLIINLLRAQLSIELSPGEDGGWIGGTMFMLAAFVCPLVLLTGIIGTTAILANGKAKA